jgi:diguanylate cyclase (GGDEF)-like protein/PAS domain S-box-containing protein
VLNQNLITAWLSQGLEEELLNAFLEHIPDGVYFKDRESRFLRISRSLAFRFGLKHPSEAIQKTDFDMFSEEHARQAFADEQEIVRSGAPVVEKEEKETWPDGHETWVLSTKLPLVNEQGNIIGIMGISRDITERKRAERELEQHRAHLEELVAQRTVELRKTNQQLECDVAARKLAEQQLALKAEELARSNAVLENLSLMDDLTGLYNRKGFLALANHRMKLAYRNHEDFSIAFVDLDGLKQINDTFGHQEGNRALHDTATVLRECFRESDILARLGGDEFAIFISEADRRKVASRIYERLADCNAASGRRYCLSLSMGILSGDVTKDSDLETLLGRADALMYEQKRLKRQNRGLADAPPLTLGFE